MNQFVCTKSTTAVCNPDTAQRYYGLDFLKAIAAFMVVSLHCPFPGIIGEYFNAIARIGVPIFFLISGFFAYKENINENVQSKLKKKILHHLLIFLLVELAYIIIYAIRNGISDFVSNFFTFDFLVANFKFGGHLWFMRALIYIEVGLYFFPKLLRSKKIVYLLPVVWLSDVLFIKYSNILFGWSIPQPYNEFLTKYLGCAFLFYFTGMAIRRNWTAIKNWLGCSFILILLLWICVLIANLAEFHILNAYSVNQMPANYISTLFLSILSFLIALKWNGDNKLYLLISSVGKKHSMYIYYWHPLIVLALSMIGSRIFAGRIEVLFVNPITAYIASLVFSFIIVYCKKLYRKHKDRK